MKRELLSIVTPAYNEAQNLPNLYERLKTVMEGATDLDWEWILVDDHSKDDTFEIFGGYAKEDERLRGVRLSRNFGSHSAITCGLKTCRGDCAVVLAADLQDPPEVVLQMLEERKKGAQVIWAVRQKRVARGADRLFGWLYYWMLRNLAGMKQVPPNGADFFMIDRRVLEAFMAYEEKNASVFIVLGAMGFRQASLEYTKAERAAGVSGWTLSKKVKLVLDSLISLTFMPLRLMIYIGFAVGVGGFAMAGTVIRNYLAYGNPIAGWSSLIVVVLILGGIQMMMMGVLGEYVWRALDESRRRPLYLVEDTTEDRNA